MAMAKACKLGDMKEYRMMYTALDMMKAKMARGDYTSKKMARKNRNQLVAFTRSLARMILYLAEDKDVATEETRNKVKEIMKKCEIEGEKNNFFATDILDMIDPSELEIRPRCVTKGETKELDGVSMCKRERYDSCMCTYPFYKIAFETLEAERYVRKLWLSIPKEDEDDEPTEEAGLEAGKREAELLQRKAERKSRAAENRMEKYAWEMEENAAKIKEAEKEIEGYCKEIEEIKGRLPYKQGLEGAYLLADALVKYMSSDLDARKELGPVDVGPVAEDRVREMRNKMLKYCEKKDITPLNFFRKFHHGGADSQTIVTALCRTAEYGSGYSSHLIAKELETDIRNGTETIKQLSYANERIRKKMDVLNAKSDNGIAA